MIKFKKIIVQNFLGYGNQKQIYDFETGITKVEGKNGSGKSAIVIDALYYVLFNRCYRKKLVLNDLVNNKNKKDMKVTLFFSRKNENYMVERSYKSDVDIFEIHKEEDGEFVLIDQDPKKNSYQQQFEDDILGVNENYFELIVIKSVVRDISFISLKKEEKLGIIENIFNIQVFNHIEQITKEKIEQYKLQILTATEKLNVLKTTFVVQQEQVLKFKDRQNTILQERLAEFDYDINIKNEELSKYQKSLQLIDTYKNKLNNLGSKINKLNSELGLIDSKIYNNSIQIKSSEQKMKIFDKYCGTCPTVQKIKDDEKIDEHISENKKLHIDKTSLQVDVDLIDKEIEKISFYTNKEKQCINGINKLTSEIKILENKKEAFLNKETEFIDSSVLKDMEKEINIVAELISDLTNKNKYELTIKKMIDPMKFFLIKRWLPYFNQKLNEYLLMLNTNINIIFDHKFDETIKLNSKQKMKYNSFSEGQKKRIDLSILFAFVDLANKITNQTFNTLILDEVDGGLDAEGVDLLLEILKEKSKNTEIIFVAHKVKIPDDKLNRKFEVKMENGFSTIAKVL